MKFFINMEKKFGKYAIRNLSAFIIAAYIAGYIMELFAPEMLSYLTLEPYYILKGQVWRVITWVLIPPSTLNIFTIIMLLFYYSVGSTLERNWGAFRYNVYIFSGLIFTLIGAFLLYFILRANSTPNIVPVFGGLFSTYYINLTIFLAFTASYPDAQVLLYFFIPLKIKWLGVLYGILVINDFINVNWVGRAAIIASLLNFILFMLITRGSGKSYHAHMRKTTYKRPPQRQQQMKRETVSSGGKGVITRHKCAVCGRTELDGDQMEFRFCSRCNGNYEYCQDHLFTHEHVQ